VEAGVAERRGLDLVGEAVDAADVVQADDRQRYEARHDDEELEDLVVDRRAQPAERDVDQHDRGRDHDRQVDRPPHQQV
jgi:hypothetical protein